MAKEILFEEIDEQYVEMELDEKLIHAYAVLQSIEPYANNLSDDVETAVKVGVDVLGGFVAQRLLDKFEYGEAKIIIGGTYEILLSHESKRGISNNV